MSITRRTAIQALAGAGATAILPRRLRGASGDEAPSEGVAVLYDPTLCVGCRECIRGCAEENGCDPGLATSDEPRLSPESIAVLRRYETDAGPTFRKVQCMHCLDPACVSACMLGAMRKDADGAVVWNGDLCVGCRYCEIACPFNVPRFEWDTPTPELTKCELCPERRARGLPPACVARCRRGALVYGTREEMLAEADRRIRSHPGRYGPEVYGEDDAGGTSVLYLAKAGVSFREMGLPELGTESVPSLPETIQHTVYKGFVAPLALFGLFGFLVHRNTRRSGEDEDDGDPGSDSPAPAREHGRPDHGRSEPVGGKLLTRPFLGLLAVILLGLAAVAWRFVAGLGATTNLNDGYAMGLWIAFDVVTGTALACGGYAVALLVYLANRGKYHPLVRAALVTSALGYTLGGLSVLIDIGRAWNFYKIPLFFWEWNVNSILLEVALCIMLYTGVLWIELSPAILERWREGRAGGLRRFALRASPKLEKAMPYLIALGLLLPTMHQSSLGSLMLLAGEKLHPLWHTPLLPLLFLISCVGMGYAAVTLECCISARVFRRPEETPMLRALAGPMAFVLLAYAAVRVVDLAGRGRLGLVARLDGYSLLFLAELALFVVPALALLVRRRSAGAIYLSVMGAMVVLAGALYRFSTYLFAFDPGEEWSYFPALPEFAVTFGIIAAEVAGYLYLVKRFPILRGAPPEASPGETDAGPPDEERGRDGSRRRRRAPALTGTAGVVALLALPLLAGTAPAQETTPGDRRCLTADPALCLDEPVPADEPHEARCATCHDLWAQGDPSGAARSCVGGECHADPESLTPFHRGLHAGVLENCVGCHPAHDARIPGGDRNCAFCHPAGGEWSRPDPAPPAAADERAAIAPARLAFRHGTHAGVECSACHAAGERHRSFAVTGLADCRGCHHTAPAASDCLGCHSDDDARAITRNVTRRFEIRLGDLDAPERTVPFAHRLHEEIACRTCHAEGLALGVDEGGCAECHEEHHRPRARCAACHALPADDAHDRSVHLGCDGAGCHRDLPAALVPVPRTRELCLVCHRDLLHHRPGERCAECHLLPPPREAGAVGEPPR